MWLIVLEALAALAVLVFVVWWTMFSGRRGGELPPDETAGTTHTQGAPDAAAPGRPGQAEGDDLGGSRKLKG